MSRRRPAGVPTRQLALEGMVLRPEEDPFPLDLLEALGTEVLSPDSIDVPDAAPSLW